MRPTCNLLSLIWNQQFIGLFFNLLPDLFVSGCCCCGGGGGGGVCVCVCVCVGGGGDFHPSKLYAHRDSRMYLFTRYGIPANPNTHKFCSTWNGQWLSPFKHSSTICAHVRKQTFLPEGNLRDRLWNRERMQFDWNVVWHDESFSTVFLCFRLKECRRIFSAETLWMTSSWSRG